MRVRLVHMRPLQQVVAQEALIVGDVLDHHFEQVVRAAGHGVALQHLWIADHRLLELVQVVAAMGRELDIDEYRDAQAELLRVEQGDLALDQPFLLHAVDAPPARRLRQLNLLGDLGGGEVGVVLQQAEDAAVDGAQLFLHEFFSLFVMAE